MKVKVILTILAVFVALVLTEGLIHGVLLGEDYENIKELLRKEDDRPMHLTFLALFIIAFAFTMIYWKGFSKEGCLKCALIYGFMTGVLLQSCNLMFYVAMPIPAFLLLKWIASGLFQCVFAGLIAWLILGRGGCGGKCNVKEQ